jgi:hypothetical protein
MLAAAALAAAPARLTLLGRVERAAAVQAMVASPDCRHVAMVLDVDSGRRRVVLDSVPGREHDDVGGFVFSPDRAVKEGLRAEAGRDELRVEGQRCGDILDLGFAPDGTAVWFAVIDGRHVLFVGGRQRLDLSTLGGIHEGPAVFSDDGRHVACVCLVRSCLTSRYVVLDGVKGAQRYDDVAGLRFRPGTQSVLFAAEVANRWQVVTDCGMDSGVVKAVMDTARYDEVRGLVSSPDGRRTAFAARRGRDWFAVVDGTRFGPEPDQPRIVFSPDSRHWACSSGAGDSMSVVLDGRRSVRCGAAGELCFGPDNRLAYSVRQGGCSFAVIGDVEGPGYDGVGQFTFSPDSRHVAYVAVQGDSWSVVGDGMAGPSFDAVVLEGGRMVFDLPDRLRYVAWRRNGAGLEVYAVEQALR